MDLDSEIIKRFLVDLRDDASIPGFLSRVENNLEDEISRMVNSTSGTRNIDVPAFTLAVDNAIRSSKSTEPNRGASPVRSFESVVNDAIRSSKGGVAESKMLKVPQNERHGMNQLITEITEIRSRLETIKSDNSNNDNKSSNEALIDLDVEAKTRMREMIIQMFYALRDVVPNVSTSDTPVSVLREATFYITELESKLKTIESGKDTENVSLNCADNSNNKKSSNEALIELDVDVNIIGRDAMIRIKCRNKNHPAVRVMTALMELELDVHNASVSVVNDSMIQLVTVKMGTPFYTHQQLRSTLLSKLSLQDKFVLN